MAKKGRPKEEKTRKNTVRVRLTDEEMEKLDLMTCVVGVSKSEIVRIALERYEKIHLKY